MDARDTALANEILRGVVGSTAHGTAIDGQDDRDEMGVFVEPPENVLRPHTLRALHLTATKPEGVRSGPGDLDLTLYSLRKFLPPRCTGAIRAWSYCSGSPEHITKTWPRSRPDTFARGIRQSRFPVPAFLGYLVAQKLKMKGERAHIPSVGPELVEKYGYDTKFAMHALRLGYEGIEMMTSGRLTLPVAEPNLSTLRAVRSGQINEAGAPLPN